MENKLVTYKHLAVGQEIKGTEGGGSNRFFSAIVKSINPAYVTVEMWRKGGDEERLDTSLMFSIEMSEKEFEEKYREKAKEVIAGIQNKLHGDELGYHEMWNAWVSYDPYEMAAACKEHELKVVGHCTDVMPKHSLIDSSVVQDIGICAEYEKSGEKIWCHWSTKDLKYLLSSWERRRRAGKEYPDGL